MLKLTYIVGVALVLCTGAAIAAGPADDPPIGEGAVEAVVLGKVVKPGGSTDKVEVPFLLLKDGRAYQEEAASPLDFRPATRPFGSWGVFTWTRTAGGYRLTAPNGGTEDLPQTGRMGQASDGLRLGGAWHAGSSSDGGRSWSETVTFDGQGSYRLEQSQSMQGGGMMGGGGWQSTGRYTVAGWTMSTDGFGQTPARKLFAAAPGHIVIGAAVYARH